MTKAKGNMYEFITHTHNVIKGKCPHICTYCYMNKLYKKGWLIPAPPYFDDIEVRKNLGKGNFIFIGSSCDMFAENIPREWIASTLIQINKYDKNKYLFQTKNPRRYFDFEYCFSRENHYLGITLETNRWYHSMGKAPVPEIRKRHFANMSGFNKFITIEPIMDFDPDIFISVIKEIKPCNVNIGADSGNNHLPEPEPDKIRELIKELEEFTEVRLKKNLRRLLLEVSP